MPIDPALLTPVRTGLIALVAALEEARLDFPYPGSDEVERERQSLVDTIEEHVLVRLADVEGPVVAAFLGPSGTGKSTLLNSVAQDRISETGAVRPTTSSPVVWAHRNRAGAPSAELVATLRKRSGSEVSVVLGDDPLTLHLTIIDSPSSEAPGGGHAAEAVLAMCDICVFVTSPSRYADASGWQLARTARDRGVPTLFVLNRMPEDELDAEEIRADFAARLHAKDLLLQPDPELIFAVSEQDAEVWHGGLAEGQVAVVRKELSELADPDFRTAVMSEAVTTMTLAVAERAATLSSRLAAASANAVELLKVAAAEYRIEFEKLASEIESGELSDVADRVLWDQAAVELAGVINRRAGLAAQRSAIRWASDAMGKQLLASAEHNLWRHGEDTAMQAAQRLQEVGEEGAEMVGERLGRRSSSSATRRVLDDAWRKALDPGRSVRWRTRRRLGVELDGLIADTREAIVAAATSAVDVDGARFGGQLGEISRDPPANIAKSAQRLLDLVGQVSPVHAPADAVDFVVPTDA